MRIATTLVIILLAASPAQASLITYNLTGKVTQAASNSMYHAPVSVGQDIPISITVDSSLPADGASSYPQLDPSTHLPLPTVIDSATFAGLDATGFFRFATTTSTSISLSTGSQMTSFGFGLSLTGASPGALQAGLLPATLDPGQFTGGTFAVIQLFNSQNGGYSGFIEGVAVPEPTTLALLSSAMLGLGLTQRRKMRPDLRVSRR